MSFELVDLRALAPQPWKNGAGTMRDIAVVPPGASMSDFDWRVSVAEVTRDAPFSAFPGVDRWIVLLSGAGLHLRSADGGIDRRLDRIGDVFAFSGDAAIDSTLIADRSEAFNLLVRRGSGRGEVLDVTQAADLGLADAGVLLCCEGDWRVDDTGNELPPMHAMLWRGAMPSLKVVPRSSSGRLLVAQVHLP
ncbi:HutD family protein [Piscinibacter sp.]|uniref:HutD/Ves family protein n=1 Tax=Piscinibacter sp. TaxID=1903157 RepID=UPI002C838849|nr:HutD family protein [Albitalea sp.]HUG22792.1 HutD family protein [Albitalea sp.]